jgi:hypothetical protein
VFEYYPGGELKSIEFTASGSGNQSLSGEPDGCTTNTSSAGGASGEIEIYVPDGVEATLTGSYAHDPSESRAGIWVAPEFVSSEPVSGVFNFNESLTLSRGTYTFRVFAGGYPPSTATAKLEFSLPGQ